jgi:hypothetical protein
MERLSKSPLVRASLVSLICVLPSLILWQVDSREWLGVNVWIKPAKFFLSVAVYFFTLHFYIGWIEGHTLAKERLSRFVILAMAIELICIVLQSARGIGSHFNTALPFDSLIYGIMGVFAFAQIPFAATLFYYLRKSSVPLSATMRTGIYWALSVFLLGCVQAAFMSSGKGHSVGGSGGVTLPFLGWSLEYGDLRVAHFVGLHGLQIFALLGWLVQNARGGRWIVHSLGSLYFAWILLLWWLALSGKPFFLFS